MAKYYGIWASRDEIGYAAVGEIPEDDVIYAGYTDEDYRGDAIVVFVKDGTLYENNDGHCSCYGLETWEPEATSIGALRMRKGWPGLQEQLDAFERRNATPGRTPGAVTSADYAVDPVDGIGQEGTTRD